MAQFPCGVPRTALGIWYKQTSAKEPKPWCPRIRCKVGNGSEPAFRFYCSRPAANRTTTAAVEPLFALYTRCTPLKYARPGWVVAAHGSRGRKERRLAFARSHHAVVWLIAPSLSSPAPEIVRLTSARMDSANGTDRGHRFICSQAVCRPLRRWPEGAPAHRTSTLNRRAVLARLRAASGSP